ncbi:hypothetical protein MPHO_26880 [Mycolicibacterium phocaicum]|uniref:Uncharacterized protein n=2 Tax=Mycolicibacterium phocaicum TaxID=319706 RepID=A0A7I7ZN86_9MYCO|nr:hypothetical protein C1S79_04665 [Mycolicibacterium phocaicum]BBZ55696.1 hypothetical protein MPHO_26880 [Mycolicibacterium phocaicum]
MVTATRALGRLEDSISAAGDAVAIFERIADFDTRPLISATLMMKHDVYVSLNDPHSALEAAQSVIDLHSDLAEPLSNADLICALTAKGILIKTMQKERGPVWLLEAQLAWAQAIDLFEQTDDYPSLEIRTNVRRAACLAMSQHASMWIFLVEPEPSTCSEARRLYLRAHQQFQGDTDPLTVQYLETAMINLGSLLSRLDDRTDVGKQQARFVVEVCERRLAWAALVQHGPGAAYVDHYHVAGCLMSKIAMVGMIGDDAAALHKLHDQMISTYGSYVGPHEVEIRRWVTSTRIRDGMTWALQGRYEKARACYQSVIDDFQGTSDPSLRREVACAVAEMARIPVSGH